MSTIAPTVVRRPRRRPDAPATAAEARPGRQLGKTIRVDDQSHAALDQLFHHQQLHEQNPPKHLGVLASRALDAYTRPRLRKAGLALAA